MSHNRICITDAKINIKIDSLETMMQTMMVQMAQMSQRIEAMAPGTLSNDHPAPTLPINNEQCHSVARSVQPTEMTPNSDNSELPEELPPMQMIAAIRAKPLTL